MPIGRLYLTDELIKKITAGESVTFRFSKEITEVVVEPPFVYNSPPASFPEKSLFNEIFGNGFDSLLRGVLGKPPSLGGK